MSGLLDLNEVFARAGDVREVARGLGEACLAEPGSTWTRLTRTAPDSGLPSLQSQLTDRLEGVDPADLPAMKAALLDVLPAPVLGDPDELQASLVALCATALTAHYEREAPQVDLRYGDVYPVPVRSPRRSYDLTPSAHNTDRMNPLGASGWRIWPYPSDTTPRVRLDFRFQWELDGIAYPDKRLPTIATLHPHAGFADLDRPLSLPPGRFFGVGPSAIDEAGLLAGLREAGDAGATIAVLPEMSLPHSDALAEMVAEHHAALPPLLVAGSAHDTGRQTNTSRVYIEGVEAFAYDKIQPYDWLDPDGVRRIEDIESGDETVVLVGDECSIAVAICSDLLYGALVERLVAAGVNTLLVPALTPAFGPFGAVSAKVAAGGRGVTAICNGSVLPADASDQPFMAIFGAPREGSHVRVVAHPSGGDRRAIFTFDAAKWRLRRLKQDR
jgi:hypothetical protein